MFKNFFFEYIYYKLFNLNTNKGEYQGVPPSVVISIIQVMVVFDVLMFAFELLLDKAMIFHYAREIGNVAVVLFILLVIINFKKYNGKIEVFESRWKNETQKVRFLKGIVVFLVIILPFLPLVLVTTDVR